MAEEENNIPVPGAGRGNSLPGQTIRHYSGGQAQRVADPNEPAQAIGPTLDDIAKLSVAQLLMDRRIKQLENAPQVIQTGRNVDPYFRVFVAKTGSTALQFKEQLRNNGAFVDADADKSRRCTDDGDPSAIITPDDDDVFLLEMEDIDDSGNRSKCYVRITGAGRAMHKVDVTKDGGLAGDASSECSFTYGFRPPGAPDDGSGDLTGVAMTGHGRRNPVGAFTDGKVGFVQETDDDPGWELVWVDEQPVMNSCATNVNIKVN